MKHTQELNHWKDMGLFGEGDYLVYGFKKTEKIVSAIYLVTSLIKDNEPLKWELRDEAIALLSLMMNLNSSTEVHKTSALQSFLSSSVKLKSLLNIADSGHLVSSMNAEIISREIELLTEFLREHSLQGMSKAGYILSDTFFSTDMKAPEMSVPQPPGFSPIHHKVRTNIASVPKNSPVATVHIKDKKDTRQTAILELLQKGSHLTIKDFVKVITDCSEKTIQRELIELVEKGTIIKEGERRWSTYSLKR